MEQVRETDQYAPTATEREPNADPYVGRELGNLRLVQKVGEGGFGSVYRAEHTGLKTSFAVKVLHFQMQNAPRAAERFRREALAIAQLSHQNIVRVSDFGEFKDGGSYLVMDFLSGDNLEDCFHHGQRFDLLAIREIISQICDALEYIHRKGVVHRDLKPANISLEQEEGGDKIVKLFDFGIAALEEDASITHTGVCMGSPLYMSPEQAVGETKHADGRTDLYSLGIIAYELLVGFPPFQGSVKSVMYKQVHQKPHALREVRPHVPWSKTLERTLQKALAKEPEERFQDAAAFREAFAEACDAQLRKTPDGQLWSEQEGKVSGTGRTSSATGLGLKESFDVAALRRKRRLRPLKIMAAISLLSLLVGAGLWQFWLGPKATQANPSTPPIQPLHTGQSDKRLKPNKRASTNTTPKTPKRPKPTPVPPLRRPTAEPKIVKLRITSTPRRAWVYFNGSRRGRTPLTLTGKTGQRYRIELRAKGRKRVRSNGTFGKQASTRYFKLRRAEKRKKKGPFDIDDPI